MRVELVLAVVLIALLAVAYVKSRKAAVQVQTSSAEDPPEPFYHPYTTIFDRECHGSELLDLLTTEGIDTRMARDAGPIDPAERLRQFKNSHAIAMGTVAPSKNVTGAAICILVDQSGSMAESMPRISGELFAALENLEASGAKTMLTGFTTVGWYGNRSRRQWLTEGRPGYPGRLCDLLHVTYSDFDEVTESKHLAPLLEPAIFFENIDGEAIVWAEQALHKMPNAKRALIVVSDGAPVDDSTLHENGPSFLWNHLQLVIGDCLARAEIAIGGIGINHRVESLFPASRMVDADGGLAGAITELAAQLLISD
jgi:cobaltochelatase CobT